MSISHAKPVPYARYDAFVVKELGDETLVYDTETHTAHCLNRTAAAVWRACDGRTTISEIARRVHREAGLPDDAAFIKLALADLGKAGLLEETGVFAAGPSRREVLKRLAVGGAVALPLISSLLAPTVASAATCLADGEACTTDAQCCSGFCDLGAGGICATI